MLRTLIVLVTPVIKEQLGTGLFAVIFLLLNVFGAVDMLYLQNVLLTVDLQ